MRRRLRFALLLLAPAALPPCAASADDDRPLAQARSDFDRDVRRAYGLLEDLQAAATAYAGAEDLAAAAAEHAKRYMELVKLHWTATRHIRLIQKEIDLRQVRAAAQALNSRRVAGPVVEGLSGHLESIAALEDRQRLLENAIAAAREADLAALSLEEGRRSEGRRRQRRRALVLGGSLAAAVLVLLLRGRRPPPPAPPSPPRPDGRHRPRGPARLQ